ncbi:hypothetical protein ACR3I8_16980 [Priestia flexa]
MKKWLLVTAASLLLAACGKDESAEQAKETAAAADTAEEQTTEEKVEKTEKEAEKENSKEETSKVELSQEETDKLRIPTVPIDSPYYEKNLTEQELVENYMDETGRIYFSLTEEPIRTIVSSTTSSKVSNITNYSDVFINPESQQAYQLQNQSEIDQIYKLILANQPAQLQGTDSSEYRTWEQATNLERGMMQMLYLVGPTMNDIKTAMDRDLYDHPAFVVGQEELEKLGAPLVFAPAPQTPLDYELFKNMKMVQAMWGQVGKFENPAENKAEFEKVYAQARQETNNLFARINYALTEDGFNQ